jgi:hypothetical protein
MKKWRLETAWWWCIPVTICWIYQGDHLNVRVLYFHWVKMTKIKSLNTSTNGKGEVVGIIHLSCFSFYLLMDWILSNKKSNMKYLIILNTTYLCIDAIFFWKRKYIPQSHVPMAAYINSLGKNYRKEILYSA